MPMKYGSVISWRGWVNMDSSFEMSQGTTRVFNFREMSKNMTQMLICEMDFLTFFSITG